MACIKIRHAFETRLTARRSILAPALTGTVLVPILASKVNDLFGINLSVLTNLLMNPSGAQIAQQKRTEKNGGKKGKKNKASRAVNMAL